VLFPPPPTNTFILTDWKVVRRSVSGGDEIICIFGKVYGNPRFRAGTTIHTSSLIGFRRDFESIVVHTRNGSEYCLGNPDPGEPFAVNRLLRALGEISATMPAAATGPATSESGPPA